MTLQLQPVGSVAGTVFAANGVTPVPGISVNIAGQVNKTTSSAGDGSFSFASVPSGAYTLKAVDGGGSTRTQAAVTVTTQGTAVVQNLVLLGLGTVTGRMLATDGSAQANVSVSVLDASGKTLTGLTNAGGTYTITQVGVGPFTARASLQTGTAG